MSSAIIKEEIKENQEFQITWSYKSFHKIWIESQTTDFLLIQIHKTIHFTPKLDEELSIRNEHKLFLRNIRISKMKPNCRKGRNHC